MFKSSQENTEKSAPVVTKAQAKKSDKLHPLKVKDPKSSVDKSTIENLQKKDLTLKKCFERTRKPVIREKYVGVFYNKNGLLYRKHQEMKRDEVLISLSYPRNFEDR